MPSNRRAGLPFSAPLAFLLPAKGERFLKSAGRLAITRLVFSLLARLINKIGEFFEKISGIMRTGSRFGVILDAEHGHFLVSEAFHRAVVKIDVRDLDVAWKAVGIHCIAMILRRDGDLP